MSFYPIPAQAGTPDSRSYCRSRQKDLISIARRTRHFLQPTKTAIMEILDAQRIVIKVGSSTIYDSRTKRVKFDWLLNFAKEILLLQERKIVPVIFCSGAIAAGSDILPEITHLEQTTQKKIKGAVGQLSISNAWIAALSK